MSQIKAIYVNLPIADVARTRAFWTQLGFTFNEQFSDDKALCLVLRENMMYSMLITHPMFESFSARPIANGTTTQVLICIEVESRERVDEVIRLALENGGTRYRESEDHGWMYYDTFADPDGHQWEVMYSDSSKLSNPS
jgi:predicted lactoylglutathione lyase